MALFFKNVCKFDGCGIVFASLNGLIEHIESCHIDFDPEVVGQLELDKPESISLSYISRYSSDDVDKHSKQTALQHHNYCVSFLNSVGSESELDDLELNNNLIDTFECDVDEEFSSEFIIRYGKQCADGNPEKPFACPVPGCKKRYKNVNGIKYHAKNGHKKNTKFNKGLKCHCGKMYKTAHGLKNHVFTAHSNSEIILPSSSSLPQPLNSLSLLDISQLSSSFNGFYESSYDCTRKSINNKNHGISFKMEMETGKETGTATATATATETNLLTYNSSSADTVLSEEKAKPNDETGSSINSRPDVNNRNRDHRPQNDDIIDVGDVNDCIYS